MHIRHILTLYSCRATAEMMISCNLCEHFKTPDTEPVLGLLRAVVSLCWSHVVTAKAQQHWLHCVNAVKDTTHGNLMKPPHLPLKRGRDLFSGLLDGDLAGGARRCSSQFPKSYIWSRRRFQSKLRSPQPSAAFFCRSYTLRGKRPFCTWSFACLQPETAPTRLQKFCSRWRGHQWSL